MPQAKLNFTGVDYIRLTANDHKPFEHWAHIVRPEFVREELAGRRAHSRWVMGYQGRVGEHCFLGQSEAGCMLQLSSGMAWQHWYEASNYSTKATRLDLQVTWPVEGDPGEYIREMYQVGQLRPQVRGTLPELQITDTPKGAKMLTVGSRTSQLYGRMYDKFRESGIPEYKQCVRWEIEVKQEAAVDLLGYMRESKSEGPTTRAIVKDFWERRGMMPFWDTFEGMDGKPPVKRTRTDDTKLVWLKTQVNPTVQGLCGRGKAREAIRAIFGEDLTNQAVDSILEAIGENTPS